MHETLKTAVRPLEAQGFLRACAKQRGVEQREKDRKRKQRLPNEFRNQVPKHRRNQMLKEAANKTKAQSIKLTPNTIKLLEQPGTDTSILRILSRALKKQYS